MKTLKAVEILQDLLSYEEEAAAKAEIQKALAELAGLTQEKSCVWINENDGYFDGYKSACGQIQYFGEGGISDNKYKFCPYCGGKIDYTPKE